jgi:hypothetical protein
LRSGAEGSHARIWHTLQALKSKPMRVLYNDGFLKRNFRCDQKSDFYHMRPKSFLTEENHAVLIHFVNEFGKPHSCRHSIRVYGGGIVS